MRCNRRRSAIASQPKAAPSSAAPPTISARTCAPRSRSYRSWSQTRKSGWKRGVDLVRSAVRSRIRVTKAERGCDSDDAAGVPRHLLGQRSDARLGDFLILLGLRAAHADGADDLPVAEHG